MAHEHDLSAHALLTPDDLASRWQLPTKTLANWRSAGAGPAYYRVGKHVRYTAVDVERWLAEQRHEVISA